MLDIRWSEPYQTKIGFASKWQRRWIVPKNMVGGFFQFWKKNKFKLLNDGFTVSKDSQGRWSLYEIKDKKT